ncbi:MAG TPA: YbfB/YjiJ family MFS transporter [Candidatus Baltobacteraceae bacterium]|nr:YbfB/YjiJ family MFS transporter [Candidatus Baltobacteraceae bacterium]
MTGRVIVWALVAMMVDIGIARLGYGLLLPAMRADLHGDYRSFGAVATLHFAGYLAGNLAGPFVLRRDPAARATSAWSHAAVAATLAASAATTSVLALGITRVLLGLATGVGVVSVFSATIERVAPERRGAVSGVIWSGLAIGLIVSALPAPWLLGVPGGWRAGTLGAAAIAGVAAIGLAVSMRARPVARDVAGGATAALSAAPDAETPFVLRDLLRPHRFMLLALAYGGGGAAYTAYATFAVAALRDAGAGAGAISAVWIALGATGIAGALTVGALMRGPLRRWAFALCLGAGAVGCALSAFSGMAFAIAGALAVGLSFATLPAIATALARMRASARTGPAAFTAVTCVFGAGQIVGPYSAGVLADCAGPLAVGWLAAAYYAAGALFAVGDGIAQRKP